MPNVIKSISSLCNLVWPIIGAKWINLRITPPKDQNWKKKTQNNKFFFLIVDIQPAFSNVTKTQKSSSNLWYKNMSWWCCENSRPFFLNENSPRMTSLGALRVRKRSLLWLNAHIYFLLRDALQHTVSSTKFTQLPFIHSMDLRGEPVRLWFIQCLRKNSGGQVYGQWLRLPAGKLKVTVFILLTQVWDLLVNHN